MKFSYQIKQGMEWLDKYKPSWIKKVDPDKLNMDHCSSCVLGQLGGFMELVEKEVGNPAWTRQGIHWCENHGFTVGVGSSRQTWIELNKQWQRAIRRRKKNAVI